MVSLTDIAELVRFVEVRGLKLRIVGITSEGLAVLVDRFPKFRRMLADQGGDLTLDDIKTMGPDMLAAGIAAGLGYPGDPEQELVAKSLTLGEQMELVTAILDVTFPKGLAHFVASIQALGVGGVSVATGKVADTKLPSSLNGSLRADTETPGNTLPVNSPDTPSSSPAAN